MMIRILGVCVGVAIGALLLAPASTSAGSRQSAIISNGTVMLGVWDSGNLNAPGGSPSSGGTAEVGLRYVPTNAESTAPGCLCEGWGAADSTSVVSGSANEADGLPVNLTVESFTFDSDSATSVVSIGTTLRVTHDYQPSGATPNLYEVTVTVENISGSAVHLLYRRVMDWDIEPTAFNEFVTMVPGTAPELVYTSDGGFAPSDPLDVREDEGAVGAFVDDGPDDHGALFDFDFGSVPPGFKKIFKTYYGAAGTEVDALAAISAVGADAYSLGQPSTVDGPTLGTPNTFIFAFGDVSSEAVPVSGEEEEEETDCLPGVPGLPCGDQAGGGDPSNNQPLATPEGATPVPTVVPPTPVPAVPTATATAPGGGRAGTITAPDTGTGDGTAGGGAAWLLVAVAGAVGLVGGGAVLAGRRVRR